MSQEQHYTVEYKEYISSDDVLTMDVWAKNQEKAIEKVKKAVSTEFWPKSVQILIVKEYGSPQMCLF